MTLPTIPIKFVLQGRFPSHAYGTDDPAILIADFGADSHYIVCSKRLATDIYAKNPSYDAAHLKQGLKDGWLKLIINPTLFMSLSNQLAAIRAIKLDETIDEGWFRLFIIPEYGSRVR